MSVSAASLACPAIKVKGKSEPQKIYTVLGRLDDPDRPRNLEELRTRCNIVLPENEKKEKKESGKDSEVYESEEVKYEILEEPK